MAITKTRRRSTSRDRRPSPADPVTTYARGVEAGDIVAGPYVRDACSRHLYDLKTAASRGLLWNPDLPKIGRPADRVLGFMRDAIRLSGGRFQGQPLQLHESQAFIVGSIFGWIREETLLRRFMTAYIEQAKGQGKTPVAAAIGHYMTAADNEASAETYAVATTREQAGILFRDAVSMARQSPPLRSRITFSGGPGREFNMAYLETDSFFRPISSESTGKGKSGYRPHCGLVDEFHEHPTNAMIEFLVANLKSRDQPLIFIITNSGVDRQSACFEYHEYARKVSAREVEDDAFFGYVCAHDEGEDPFEDPPHPELGYPLSWLKTNPLLGVTVKPPYLEKQVREAKGMPSKESIVRRLNFCEWVDAADPWIDGDLWRQCETEDPIEHDGPTFLALDLSSKRDLTSSARASVDSEGVVHAEIRAWTPADLLVERERNDHVPYSAWVRDAHLNAVPGRSIDYGFVVKDIAEWLSTSAGCAFDPWRIDDFLTAMDDAGIDGFIRHDEKSAGPGIALIPHGQGFGGGSNQNTLWMPRSIGDLEDLVLSGRLRVKKNPVLTWASASAVLAADPAGNRKWEKRKSTGRIDALVALSMAVGLALSSINAPPDPPRVLVLDDGISEPTVEEDGWW